MIPERLVFRRLYRASALVARWEVLYGPGPYEVDERLDVPALDGTPIPSVRIRPTRTPRIGAGEPVFAVAWFEPAGGAS